MRNEPTSLQDLTEKFSQLLLNDSLTLRLNDLQQSELSACWQAQPKFGTTNFFMDDTKWYDVTIIFLEMLDFKT